MSIRLIREAYKQVGEKMIELGYCSDFRINMRTGAFLVSFTERGEQLRRQLTQIHEAVATGNLETDETRQMAILEILLQGSDSPGDFFYGEHS
jgi:hypothetical protein